MRLLFLHKEKFDSLPELKMQLISTSSSREVPPAFDHPKASQKAFSPGNNLKQLSYQLRLQM
jgi:hypothetical protein